MAAIILTKKAIITTGRPGEGNLALLTNRHQKPATTSISPDFFRHSPWPVPNTSQAQSGN